MPKVQAFLSLEQSASATMASTWAQAAGQVMSKLQPLVESGRFDDAHDLVSRVTMNGVVEAQRKRLEELAVSSLLFGAHNVAGQVRDTSFVKGTQELPYALQQALDQLTDVVEVHGAELVRREAHAFIRSLEVEPDPLAKTELREAANYDFADQLNAAVMGTGKVAIDIGANLTTSRLVTLGFLAEAMERKVDTYQVNEVLDERICPVCRYMHGKRFHVAHEYSRTLTALGTMDTKELKSIAPWPSQSKASLEKLNGMSLSELQTAGFGSPPYHPGCRGVLMMTGTVTEAIPLGKIAITAAKRKKPKVVEVPEAAPISLSIIGDAYLREQVSKIKSEASRQKALSAYESGNMAEVRAILVAEGIIAGEQS